MIKKYIKNKKGQAMIAILLVLALALIFLTTTAVIYLSETSIVFNTRQSNEAYYNAEATIDNAILKLLRNPNYTGDETLTFNNGSATIGTITGSTTKTITVNSQINNNKYIRIMTATVNLSGSGNRVVTLNSWREQE